MNMSEKVGRLGRKQEKNVRQLCWLNYVLHVLPNEKDRLWNRGHETWSPRLHCILYSKLQFNLTSTTVVVFGVILQDKQQKLQNRAARVLTFSSYDADAGQLLEILGWKNLDRQRNIPSWFSNAYMG